MEHPAAEHMKLKPKHEKVIMLLGAIAGIIGLILLIKQHSAAGAGASAVSPDIATGVGSSAGGYGYSTTGGSSGGSIDAGTLSSLLGSVGSTATGAASPPTPATADTTPDPSSAAGSTTTLSALPPPVTTATVTPTGASTYPSDLGGTGPATPAPAAGGGDTRLSNIGNTNTTINEQNWTNNTTTNTTTTNIAGSFNGGNGNGSIGSSLPAFQPDTGGGLAGYQGGSHFPISGGGIVIPPPVGISPAAYSTPGHEPIITTPPAAIPGGSPPRIPGGGGSGGLLHPDPHGPGLRSGVVYK